MSVMPPVGASARTKFGTRKATISPVVGVLAVLGATYLLSSPIPAILGIGLYAVTRKKTGDITADEPLEQVKQAAPFNDKI